MSQRHRNGTDPALQPRPPWPGTAAAALAPGPDGPPVPPPPSRPGLAWGHTHGLLQAVSVWTERVPGRGEDAEPFVAHHWDSGQGLLAVFDGSGGSGAAPAWQAHEGTSRTSAWVGARTARLATECWLHEVIRDRQDVEPHSLHEHLKYFLAQAPQRHSKIGGTMRRQLPTTLAGMHYRIAAAEAEVELRPLWAGDSRAYALLPGSGLHVLTRDHTRESDALELLRSDPPMTNLICADRDFDIDSHHLVLPLPCVLVAATDGFFGYVHTPADFENLLLYTLRHAGSPGEWAHLLRNEVESFTADDASLALLALGYRDFDELRAEFMPRRRQLAEQQSRGRPSVLTAAPGPATNPHETAARIKAWQDQSWQAYRRNYESYMPPAPEEFA